MSIFKTTIKNTSMNPKYFICVFTGRFFDRLRSTLNEVFLENSLQRFPCASFGIFESKFVNFSTHCQFWKTSRKLMFYITFEANRIQGHIFTNPRGLIEALIFGQFLPKGTNRNTIWWATNLYKMFFLKNAGRQKIVQYMKYFGFIDVFSTV